jgi:8-oxo-dGTP diphosphatase
MKNLNVVVGILLNEQNEVLIALRPPHVVQPGVWEFPGGKVEENESLENALIREFHEEIGIKITKAEFFLKIEKPFPTKNILLQLHTFKVLEFHGTPRGCENQEIRWVKINTLNNYTFPEANADIVRALMG